MVEPLGITRPIGSRPTLHKTSGASASPLLSVTYDISRGVWKRWSDLMGTGASASQPVYVALPHHRHKLVRRSPLGSQSHSVLPGAEHRPQLQRYGCNVTTPEPWVCTLLGIVEDATQVRGFGSISPFEWNI